MEENSWLSKQTHIGLKIDLRSLCMNTEILAACGKKNLGSLN